MSHMRLPCNAEARIQKRVIAEISLRQDGHEEER